MTTDPSRQIVIASFPSPAGATSALELLKGSTVGLGNTATIVRERASQVVVQAGGVVMGTSHESDLAAAMANLKRP
jgi:hypothetical protein